MMKKGGEGEEDEKELCDLQGDPYYREPKPVFTLKPSAMMQARSLILLTALFLFSGLSGPMGAFAQKGQIAHVDLQGILETMPEREKASQRMDRFREDLTQNIQEMNEEYQSEMTEFQQNQEEMTQTEQKRKREELAALQQRIQQAQQKAQEDLQSQQEELLQPIMDKVEKAVQEVAKKEGYMYVVQEQNLLYKEGGNDITDKVRDHLDLGRGGSSGSEGGEESEGGGE